MDSPRAARPLGWTCRSLWPTLPAVCQRATLPPSFRDPRSPRHTHAGGCGGGSGGGASGPGPGLPCSGLCVLPAGRSLRGCMGSATGLAADPRRRHRLTETRTAGGLLGGGSGSPLSVSGSRRLPAAAVSRRRPPRLPRSTAAWGSQRWTRVLSMSRLPSLLPPGSPRSPLSLITRKLPGPITPANSFKKPSTPPPYKYQALSWALAEGVGGEGLGPDRSLAGAPGAVGSTVVGSGHSGPRTLALGSWVLRGGRIEHRLIPPPPAFP